MIGKAVIFSAPSGSGKTTIVRHLQEKIPELAFSISATTRHRRDYEVDGKDYYFLSLEEFNRNISGGNFIEWEEVYAGAKYGTLKKEIERIWSEGKVVIFDVDVVGGKKLKQRLGEAALALFVRVPNMYVLKERLKARNTESDESMELRLGKAERELSFEHNFDRTIINDNLKTAQNEAERIVKEFIAK